jgi:hypothetical protein
MGLILIMIIGTSHLENHYLFWGVDNKLYGLMLKLLGFN